MGPYYERDGITLYCGDSLEVVPTLERESIAAVCTDPPYGLGFMGKAWDKSVPGVPFWTAFMHAMKPGAHLLAFGGSRTYHRMGVAIEDAGLELRDTLMWLYGSGFPKSHDVSKAIDKAAGAERGVVGYKPNLPGLHRSRATVNHFTDDAWEGSDDAARAITAPATPEAAQWAGWGTALKPAHEPVIMARKPLRTSDTNVLDMVNFQLRELGVTGDIQWKTRPAKPAAKQNHRQSSTRTKPQSMAGTSAANASGYGIDDSGKRIESESGSRQESSGAITPNICGHTNENRTEGSEPKSSQLMAANAPVAESGNSTSSPSTTSTAAELSTEKQFSERCTKPSSEQGSPTITEYFVGIAIGPQGSTETVRIIRDVDGVFIWPDGLPKVIKGKNLSVAANVLAHGTGAINIDASRIGIDADERRVIDNRSGRGDSTEGWGHIGIRPDGERYTSHTAGRWPANVILDEDAAKALDAQSGERPGCKSPSSATPTSKFRPNQGSYQPQGPIYGDTGGASRFFYCAKASRRERGEGNDHPTVKPLALMRYLVTLITPPGGIVLDPFAGSGSTLVACAELGIPAIGIELSEEYAEIAARRIDHVLTKGAACVVQPSLLEGVAD